MITTKKIKLTQRELFLLLVWIICRKQWLLFVSPLALSLAVCLLKQIDSWGIAFIILTVAFPASLILKIRRHVTSKKSNILLMERYYEIDTDEINGIITPDTSSAIPLEYFIKVDFVRNTYLLYVTKQQFIYIPANSFEKESDREWFEKEIVSIINKKTT